MQTFEAGGKSWTINLTIAKAKRIKSELKLDLLEADAESSFQRIIMGPLLRLDLLWLILDESCKATKDEFDAALDGSNIKAANTALWEELDFFIQSLQPDLATTIQAMRAKAMDVMARQSKLVQTITESPEMATAIDKAMTEVENSAREALGNLSTSSLAL